MRCPKCRTLELKPVTPKGTDVEIDCCPKCKGMWFDAGELQALIGVAVEGLKVPGGSSRWGRTCPKCDEPLYGFEYPQTLVMVDMCKSCGGLWLDTGELKEIRIVRRKLKQTGQLEKAQPPSGVKGALINFINRAMGGVTRY